MIAMERIKWIKLTVFAISALILVSCTAEKDTADDTAETDPALQSSEEIISASYKQEDVYTGRKGNGTNVISLGSIEGSRVVITAAGTYELEGELSDGTVIVDAGDDDIVTLILNNAAISCSFNPAINVRNAGKVIISLPEETKNHISDGCDHIIDDQDTDQPDAAIYSKADLTISGRGLLMITAGYNNGIAGKDDLIMTGGDIRIISKDDAILGRDMVLIDGAEIKIDAGGDGIRTTNGTDASKGNIFINNGIFDIRSGADGIQAVNSVIITGGEFSIVTDEGSAGVTYRSDFGMPGMRQPQTTAATADTQSAKGLKAAKNITVSGGSFVIDSRDDAIHSNDTVIISGGDFHISSGDDGIHADTSVEVQGGDIKISKCYEGIESAGITITAGDIQVASWDDGINIVGGNDGSSLGGRPGQNAFNSSGNDRLTINGGYVAIDAAGDGLDINGAIYMNGGTLIIHGPTSDNNSALDFDRIFEMNGGFLVAAGSAGMAQAPGSQSAQEYIAITFSRSVEAGMLINLTDADGKEVLTFAPSKQYRSFVASTPDLVKNMTYTVSIGGESTGTPADGLYSDGEYKNGTVAGELTLN